MLRELAIRDLGVIEAAKVELSGAYTVITGETGAGKTMLITALDQLTGGKGDSALVRAGAERSVVGGIWGLAPNSPSRTIVIDAGGDLDGEEVIATRVVLPAGRSRASLGGVAVPAGTLAEAIGPLVAVHGQADQQRLRSISHQRAMLDHFAGPDHLAKLAAYQDTYRELGQTTERLERLRRQDRQAAREAESLARSLAEIRQVAPQVGEEDDLAQRAARLSNAEHLRAAATGALLNLAGAEEAPESNNALGSTDAARRLLDTAGDDPALKGLADRVREVAYQLSDIGGELGAFLASLEADPAELEAVHERRAAINSLLRKYGPDTAAVLAWADEATARLDELDGGAERQDELTAAIAGLTEQAKGQAAALTKTRRAAVKRLEEAVNRELAGLAMPDARFTIRLAALAADAGPAGLGPHGAESVEFGLVAHANQPVRPLGRGASGGELSRVMLALEVSLAAARKDPGEEVTLVFDEIDAGVGGKAAVEVGRRLARLAKTSQVVVVTHLAQVAAFADRHIVVVKDAGPAGAVTQAVVVQGADRERELARMLAGQEDSATAQAHAKELLALGID